MNQDTGISIGLVLTIVVPLLGALYFAIQLRINKHEQGLEKMRELYVTRELFSERTTNQDRALIRIEKALGLLAKQRGRVLSVPDSDPPEER